MKALEVLKQHSVEDRKVIVLTLFATPESKLIGCVTFPICVCIECWAYGHEIRVHISPRLAEPSTPLGSGSSKWVTVVTGSYRRARESNFLFQQLSVALQRGNAISFQNAFTAS